MKRTFLFLLALVGVLGLNAKVSPEALQSKVKKVKAQIEHAQNVFDRNIQQNDVVLKSTVVAKNYLTTIEGDWGRKVFTYNDQGKVTDYKFFFIDPYYDDSEEVLKEHQLYTYDNNGNTTSFVLNYYDEWEGWKVIEKEEHTYNSQSMVTSSVYWDFDNFESQNPYRKETYEYNGKTARVDSYYWSEETDGWEHEGFADYEFDNNDRLIRAENHTYNEDTGVLELTFITIMTYNAAGELTRIANQFYDEIEEKFVDFIVSETVYNAAGNITEETTTMSSGGMTVTMDQELYFYSNGKLTKHEAYMPNYETFELYLFEYTEYEYQNGALASETNFTIDYSSASGFVATQKYEFEFNTNYSASNLVMPDIFMYDNYVADDIVDASYSEYGMLTVVNVFAIDYDTQQLMPAKTANYNYSSDGTSDLSSDATLAGVFVDGALLEGFNSNIFTYQVELPYNYSGVPEVTANATHNNADVDIIVAEDIPGETVINVMAEDGETTYAYTVEFKLAAAPGSDASLIGIYIDGEMIEGFDTGDFEYWFNLSGESAEIPDVTASATDPNASVEIDIPNELPATVVITVTAVDGETVEYYYVNIAIEEELSNDATLAGIYIDGVLLENFNNSTDTYNLVMQSPVGILPEVTAEANDAGATVVITPTYEVPGTVLILVVAADGITSLMFTINISVENGVDDVLNSMVKTYPNPCAGSLNIELSTSLKINSLRVYSINGKEISSKIFNDHSVVYQLDTSDLLPGVYYLAVKYETGNESMVKFVKQ
ncbi:MAG TPA: T9SS type A sorting domain-containing protein [Prolixibacteraceae bacterium]|nr:T9SS type A sorting domain-containing protein [Prolixibacteraceae bacterium]